MIDILYFARVREQLGRSEEQLELPPGVGRVADLLTLLRDRGEPWATALSADTVLLMAVNQAIARLDTPLKDGDEIAIFPPVTGG
ncbi:molybdopterin converting factor subunit 1 [Thiocapsa imhoffii]|uniref:Molybdopterin synthase sulfur carrier subunit n=1 Tax=Thiocapsa imhoffii TaxID=382777 RepID=A0A9X0WJW4_9GAMM|nr:molybdopterin converting factor subunit 1 [Thiocapsa imhoffii]MBK1645669.1 molybdopterin converting factor subunit 1 [Thiocapsa imhoffii]